MWFLHLLQSGVSFQAVHCNKDTYGIRNSTRDIYSSGGGEIILGFFIADLLVELIEIMIFRNHVVQIQGWWRVMSSDAWSSSSSPSLGGCWTLVYRSLYTRVPRLFCWMRGGRGAHVFLDSVTIWWHNWHSKFSILVLSSESTFEKTKHRMQKLKEIWKCDSHELVQTVVYHFEKVVVWICMLASPTCFTFHA